MDERAERRDRVLLVKQLPPLNVARGGSCDGIRKKVRWVISEGRHQLGGEHNGALYWYVLGSAVKQ